MQSFIMFCPEFSNADPIMCHECFDPKKLEIPEWVYTDYHNEDIID